MDDLKERIWASYYAALDAACEQVVDAIAATSVDAVLEHGLTAPPHSPNRAFKEVFKQRHPAIWEAIEAAYAARNDAAEAALKEEAKQRGIAKRQETLARKKASTFIRDRASFRSPEFLAEVTGMPVDFVNKVIMEARREIQINEGRAAGATRPEKGQT